MLSSPLRWILLLAVLGGGLWLRTRDLAARPMHADEANQAVKAGELLEHGRYVYDPTDHHGPTLYYLTLPVAWARGEAALATLTETSVRLVPALAGTLTLLLTFLLARSLGFWPALLAAALVAVAPPSVYYSRYFVHESLLLTFFLAAAVAVRAWWRNGGFVPAALAGLSLGLMQATKANAPLFAVAGLLAWLATSPGKPASAHGKREVAVGVIVALATLAALYSSFGHNPAGLLDAARVYASAWSKVSTGAGHDHPWYYYGEILAWHPSGGLLFQQLAFVALAVAGGVVAWFASPARIGRWCSVFVLLVAVALSVSPYKTPWHVIHLVPALAILAALAISLVGRLPRTRPVAVLLAAAALFLQGQQTQLAAFTRPADERNPYAYVHSSPDVLKARPLVLAARQRHPGEPVRVISEENWPLPWYLRGVDGVGYWTSVPDNCDGALVLASASLANDVRAKLHGAYRTEFLGLRPGFTFVVFTR